MPRIIVTVSNTELAGLLKLAHSELRTPKDQLRFILRKELIQLELQKSKLNHPLEELDLASLDQERGSK